MLFSALFLSLLFLCVEPGFLLCLHCFPGLRHAQCSSFLLFPFMVAQPGIFVLFDGLSVILVRLLLRSFFSTSLQLSRECLRSLLLSISYEILFLFFLLLLPLLVHFLQSLSLQSLCLNSCSLNLCSLNSCSLSSCSLNSCSLSSCNRSLCCL